MGKKSVAVLLAIMVFVALSFPAIATGEQNYVRKIVVFNKTVKSPAQDVLIKKFGVKLKGLPIVNGAVVMLPPKAAADLARSEGVVRIEDDLPVFALGRKTPAQPTPQVTPWGVERVNAPSAWATSTASGINVAIIDTGIDLTHPDLQANIKSGFNAIRPGKSANDDNGHGTHVAGIVAAVNNSIGVVGVAHQANLYPVKVLNKAGWGWTSDIIEGLQWCVSTHTDTDPTNDIRVANMSFGASGSDSAEHDAIVAAHNAGITLVAAAGNDSGGAVNYPAAYPEVIAVSATDYSDAVAYFSSSGPEIDLAAPGVSIYSTYKGWTYKTLSGTSMAAPHVTGVAALVLATPVGAYDLNGNGIWDPAEVQAKLEATARDLGSPGKDSIYGDGLVDAASAVMP